MADMSLVVPLHNVDGFFLPECLSLVSLQSLVFLLGRTNLKLTNWVIWELWSLYSKSI